MIRVIALLAAILLCAPASAQGGAFKVWIENVDFPLPRPPCPQTGKISGWPDPEYPETQDGVVAWASGYLSRLQSCGFITRSDFNRGKSEINKTVFVPICGRRWDFGTGTDHVSVLYWGEICQTPVKLKSD